jgi:hypothetical protein
VSFSATIVTDPTGGFDIDLWDEYGLKTRHVEWAQTLWGARRLARRVLKRENKKLERGTRVVEEVR